MAVTLYTSSDTGAPTLTGEVGSLVNVLDKCLVTGYGSKAAAGWTKPYAGTNKAAFRMGAGTQHYLRVQDDAPGAAGAREVRIRGYEVMTDVDTGTGLFPTATQLSAGIIVRKSASLDATARTWVVLADARTFHLFTAPGDTAGVYSGFMFGEVYAFGGSGDAFRTGIIGRNTENVTTNAADRYGDLANDIASMLSGHYLARAYTGAGSAVACGKIGNYSLQGSQQGFIGTIAAVNPADGGLHLVSPTVTEAGPTLRGRVRGVWAPMHVAGFAADRDTFSGVGDLAGKTFLCIKTLWGTQVLTGIAVLETSDTWDTN